MPHGAKHCAPLRHDASRAPTSALTVGVPHGVRPETAGNATGEPVPPGKSLTDPTEVHELGLRARFAPLPPNCRLTILWQEIRHDHAHRDPTSVRSQTPHESPG